MFLCLIWISKADPTDNLFPSNLSTALGQSESQFVTHIQISLRSSVEDDFSVWQVAALLAEIARPVISADLPQTSQMPSHADMPHYVSACLVWSWWYSKPMLVEDEKAGCGQQKVIWKIPRIWYLHRLERMRVWFCSSWKYKSIDLWRLNNTTPINKHQWQSVAIHCAASRDLLSKVQQQMPQVLSVGWWFASTVSLRDLLGLGASPCLTFCIF